MSSPPTSPRSPVPLPKMKLSPRDSEKVEQARQSKLEVAKLRAQVAVLETKQETDRVLVEQLPEVMTELAKLREAVAGMEKNERELTSEVDRLKQAAEAAQAAHQAAHQAAQQAAEQAAQAAAQAAQAAAEQAAQAVAQAAAVERPRLNLAALAVNTPPPPH